MSDPVGRRTIHVGLRVSDRERSVRFYRSLGYEVVGEVLETPIGRLTMLKLPGDEFVTIELVSDPPTGAASGLSHLVVTVDSVDDAASALRSGGSIDAPAPGATEAEPDPDSPRTLMLHDPDGHAIELVQWPDGHPDGFTAADFPG